MKCIARKRNSEKGSAGLFVGQLQNDALIVKSEFV